MNTNGILLCVMICCTAVHCFSSTLNSQKCRDMNPFIAQLEKKGNVVLFDAPKITTDACAFEWGVYGSCCNQKSLKKHVLKDVSTINDSVTKSMDFLKKYSKSIQRLFEEANNKKDELKGKEMKSVKKKIQKFATAFLSSSLDKLQGTTNYILSDAFEKQYRSCWSTMEQVRSSSVCFTCSGRSSVFFKGSKILINTQTCHDILSKCQATFSTLVDFFTGLEVMTQRIKHELKNEDDIIDLIYFIEKIDKVTEDIKRNRIQALIKQYISSNINDKISRANVASELCSMLVTISNEPFILQTRDVLDDYDFELLDKVSRDLQGNKAWIKHNFMNSIRWMRSRRGNWKKGRVLQFVFDSISDQHKYVNPFDNIPSNTYFKGDVNVIRNVDSSYTSYVGALGTTGHDPSRYLQAIPLNTTTLFP